MREDSYRQPPIVSRETIVLVCGGRHFGEIWDTDKMYWRIDHAERAMLNTTLTNLHERRGFTLLIHGAASGADTLSEAWALKLGISTRAYPAAWQRLGRIAGFERNKQMLVEGKPQLVIAFKGNKGTKMMIDLVRKASVEVITPGWKY